MKLIMRMAATLLLSLSLGNTSAQSGLFEGLEQRLMQGDKSALYQIATYFDSKKPFIEMLGYHIINTDEASVAKRIVSENCIFMKHEIEINGQTTTKQFTNFLNNATKLQFSALAEAFLITPLESRTARVEFREITQNSIAALKQKYTELLSKDWVTNARIHTLIAQRDPKALLIIASELYKERYRFNRHNSNKDVYTNLLQLLTHCEVAVETEKKELSWHVAEEFYPDASLNLLIYFAGNYVKYSWDENAQYFKNDGVKIKPIAPEHVLFQLLRSDNDSLAIDAFIQLTSRDPVIVSQLAKEYDNLLQKENYALPTFPYRFLNGLSLLVQYCKDNKLHYTGTPQLMSAIHQLESYQLSFSERRKLEDQLINTFSFDEITALEYWTAIKGDAWYLIHSTGRILDIFYSKHWEEIVNNDAQLKLYLMKSHLYTIFGIIGICNNYLQKFIANGAVVSERLSQLTTNDEAIKAQIEKARANCLVPLKRPNDPKKVNDANRDYVVISLEAKIKDIANNTKDLEERAKKLSALLSRISYDQIGTAIRAIENVKIDPKLYRSKYSFINDFGLLWNESLDSTATRESFLRLYNSLSEFNLYAHYLDKNGIVYNNPDGSLNYDNIYEILKYNVVTAFVGGGGGKRDNEVYSVVKILELTHRTTLGYPKKRCNSNDIWYCDALDRAREWMQYLIDKNLLKEPHKEPVSFSYK